jgi:hypothetical protein
MWFVVNISVAPGRAQIARWARVQNGCRTGDVLYARRRGACWEVMVMEVIDLQAVEQFEVVIPL